MFLLLLLGAVFRVFNILRCKILTMSRTTNLMNNPTRNRTRNRNRNPVRNRRISSRKPRTRTVNRTTLGLSPLQIYRYENNQNLQQYVQYSASTWSYAMALTYIGNSVSDYGRGSDCTPLVHACDLVLIMRQAVNYSYTYRFMVVEFLDRIDVSDYNTFMPSLILEANPTSSTLFSVQEKLRRNQDPMFKVLSDRLITWDTTSYVSQNIRTVKIHVPACKPVFNFSTVNGSIASRHQLLFVLTDATIQSNVFTTSYSMYRTFNAEQ